MKRLNKITYLLMAFVVALTSCEVDRTESVFSDPPAIRIANIINELKTTMIAQPQGYSGIYFPNNTLVGGVNLHMKFSADLRVKITSDFKSNTSLTDTRFDIITGSTAAELVFTSGSRHITDLVQDGSTGFKTFYGNNALQYVGEENGVLTFREVRSNGILVLKPSGFTNFDNESVANTNATFASKQAFTASDCATTSVFRTLLMDVTNATETTKYIVTYNAANQFATAETTNSEGFAVSSDFGVAFTQTNGVSGITISPTFEAGGVKFENFVRNTAATDIEYTATVDGVTARMYFNNLPTLNNDLNELNVLNRLPVFWAEPRFGVNSLTSCGFDAVIARVDANLRTQGWAYNGYNINLDYNSTVNLNNNSRIILLVTNVATGAATSGSYYIRVKNENNLVFLTSTGVNSGNGNLFANSARPLLDFFFSAKGLAYKNEGSFVSNTNRFINQAATFTSMDNPALRSYGLWRF